MLRSAGFREKLGRLMLRSAGFLKTAAADASPEVREREELTDESPPDF